MIEKNAVFDAIVNSEDAMLKRIELERRYACIYLRAYIIIRLIFFREFIITDSAVNLNRAFRTLVLADEANGYYNLNSLPKADFGWLIDKGFIRVAARDTYQGSFSEMLRIAHRNKHGVDLPSEKYSKLIDEICKYENIYWWNSEAVSQMFTTKFKNALDHRLTDWDPNYSNDAKASLCNLSEVLKDKEDLTYNWVKTNFLEKHSKESSAYRLVYGMLRRSYDYNIPEILKLDCSSFPEKSNDFHLPLSSFIDYKILWPYRLNIYAFAAFPAELLEDIWHSPEYIEYEQQMQNFRNGTVRIDEFLGSLEKYLAIIDKRIALLYNYKKYSPDSAKIRKLADVPVAVRSYFREEKTGAVAIKFFNHFIGATDLIRAPLEYLLSNVLVPNLFRSFSEEIIEPPSAIGHAVIKVDRRGIPDGIPGTV